MGLALLLPTSQEITEEIESVRSKMMELGSRYGMMHPEVQHCSQHLDRLLNLYYDLEVEKR